MSESALVLVHSPLVGPSTWEPVAQTLRGRGHTVLVPALTPVLEAGGPYRSRMASVVAGEVDRNEAAAGGVVLVVHSGAGALVPSFVAALDVPVPAMVFVDALLPHPGRSWFDTVSQEVSQQLFDRATGGFLPPWAEWFPPGTIEELLPEPELRSRFLAEQPRLPLDYTTEVAPHHGELDERRCGYLQLSEGYASEAVQVAQAGWIVRCREAHHLAMLTDPEGLATAIVDLTEMVKSR